MADLISLRDEIETLRTNPAAIQRKILSLLEETNAGKRDVVDPSNPFIFLLEANAVTASAGMLQAEALTRKQYPSMALTEDELYLHMSDLDFLGRFSNPSRTSFVVLMSKDELYQRAVDTGVNGVRKLVIPRNTEFTVAGIVFSMQYPIEIRIMPHGGLQIVYDVSRVSPLATLESNMVDWTITRIDQQEFLALRIPVQQFQITTHYAQLSEATGLNKTYPLTDGFYYCRVYAARSDGSWEEIQTTHTDQVFDPLKPTVVLRVYESSINVKVPHVYLTTGLLERELRIDIYTTRGPLDMVLDNYDLSAFSAKWKDLEQDDKGVYSAPLSLFTTMAVYSDSAVTGGTARLSFEELRERVLTNALGQKNLPITNAQLTPTLEDLGYTLVKDVDNVTNRIFLASRTLPAPGDGQTITGANARVVTLQSSFNEMRVFPSVADNGSRLTLLPNTLYHIDNGVVRMVTAMEYERLMALTVDQLADEVSEQQYLYTPFHYVLDAADEIFSARAYYLDNPKVAARQFIQENPTSGFSVGTQSVVVTRTAQGYKLRVVTRSGVSFKELPDERIYAQLMFRPVGEDLNVYLNGTLVGDMDGERIYEFDLETNYDIDAEHNLTLTSFSMFDSEERKFSQSLLGDFELLYVVEGTRPKAYRETEIDHQVGADLLPVDYMGVAHERFTLRLGWSLEGLWSNTRTVVTSQQYLRYTQDVPMVFEANVYERDPVTGAVKITKNADGSLNYNLLHRKGDPVLDAEGNQVYKHFAGDVVLDNDGQPIPESGRDLWRQVDLCLIDGRYYFATEAQTVAYRKSLAEAMVSWVTEDVAQISERLLEQTRLYFYPQSTLGEIRAIVEEGKQVTMDSSQRLVVTYYLSKTNYRNSELRTALTEMAVETVAEALKRATVTTNDIISKLTAKAGEDVLGIDLDGLGGEEDYTAVTVVDDSMRCSVAKRLVALADNTLAVEDDVQINFIQHKQ